MKNRLLFNNIHKHLDKKQITLILGARQTGKTTLLKQVQSSLADSDRPATYISLEDKEILTAFNQRPDNLFQFIPPSENGKRQFIFIDEVQYLDDPSNFLKYLYDEHWEQLKLVVTGSSGFYIDQKFKAVRYHSLVADKIPDCFEVSARHEDIVMAIRHKTLPIEGVQFHPESVLTMKKGNGLKIIKNLLESYLK